MSRKPINSLVLLTALMGLVESTPGANQMPDLETFVDDMVAEMREGEKKSNKPIDSESNQE